MMLRPFLYDLKRTITTKSVIILATITLLVSLVIVPLASFTGFSGFSSSPGILYYRDNNGYHFLAYAYNEFGDPSNGIKVSFTFTGPGNYSQAGTTNSTGLAFVTVNAPPGNYTVTVKASDSGGAVSDKLGSPPQGAVYSLGYPFFSPVVDKANASKRDVQVFYAGPSGALPSDYSLYYKVVIGPSPPSQGGSPFSRSQMSFLGNLTDYHQVFDPPIPAGLDSSATVWFELFARNGTVVFTSPGGFPIFELRPPRLGPTASDLGAAFFENVLGFFIPLAAIMGSYSSYGKDRLTGVLESVLARPVSRRGLAASRYASTTLAIGLAVVGSVGVVDLILSSVAGGFLSQEFMVAVIAALLVEVAAFTGLVFLFSHLVKSTGALLGIMIGLFIVLELFWGLIVFLVTSLMGGTPGSAVSIQASVLASFANPAKFISLTIQYVLGSSSGVAIQPSAYGLSPPALVLDGLFWAVGPFLLFLYLAMKRD